VTDGAKAVLASEGFDPVYGARPLKRVIQRRIENELAMRLLQGEFGEGATVRVEAAPTGELLFTPVGEMVAA
jgi:ATP-dependent Clp protease ATP-binding subunit ClpB